MDVASLSTALGTPSKHVPDSPQKIHDAASQFEALLIGEVLKSAQSGDGKGWLGSGDEEDSGGTSAMEFGTDYFARAIASKGGLGLSKMIESAMTKKANSSSPATQPAPAVDIPPSDQ